MSQPFKFAVILAFAALPLLEIGLLIRLGQVIGIWWLAVIIIGTAVLGTYVIRRVGLSVFERALSRLGTEREGFPPLFDGFLQVLAGLLLIFPGVISDLLGLFLLVPQIRHLVIRTGLLKLVTLFHYQAEVSRETFRASSGETPTDGEGIVIEGEYERVSEKPMHQAKAVQPRRYRS
ncbi:FxsA family protein [Hyphomicrobium sp.]|uniref:FxsA family protein n=1 Tax=Hyphomicrobium sp. TaxID=82 RepID=UPI000FBD5701|nr:FxsA family protein [Hyphomicrobium sp.]RUP08424.1 MAG: FxsA family protein [Hyphomicrobium sp.]